MHFGLSGLNQIIIIIINIITTLPNEATSSPNSYQLISIGCLIESSSLYYSTWFTMSSILIAAPPPPHSYHHLAHDADSHRMSPHSLVGVPFLITSIRPCCAESDQSPAEQTSRRESERAKPKPKSEPNLNSWGDKDADRLLNWFFDSKQNQIFLLGEIPAHL